ncbi:MAG: bifunctional UDP-N-acetylglucosamine diphosphorylase/glucosamine-1-phosphate N-acetyltransferase GlmU [Actinobacteria bacterium]|nr:bifunctional UDP-N-acetylglucosamine diphosphorylase/glucosamine-1-phosphate N-acetyltransferase GlmU [Actinomycetota bacterium]
MTSPKPTVVVLAAGKGKRLRSPIPKVLHRVAGRPLFVHVLTALSSLSHERAVVVVSKEEDAMRAAAEGAGFTDLEYVVQDPPNGTGDAVKVALEHLGVVDDVALVVNGDTPLVRAETLKALVDVVREGATAAVLTATVADPADLGRVVRRPDGSVERIVEARDATPAELEIVEVNCGAYAFDGAVLSELISKIDRENAQGEYYLTDVVQLMVSEGHGVEAHMVTAEESAGVNDRKDLAEVGALLRAQICEKWLQEGVTIVDPSTTYIDADVTIEPDATILPFTFLEGATTIAAGAEVGPNSRIVDSEVGPGATVTYSVVRGSTLGPESSVGPYASLRPGTTLGRGARIGTFVETKATSIGDDSKANHLAYLGDAEIGRGVNVGAGTITCNWDGRDKHKTIIDDDAYIGSDTMLVAPTHIGKRAATAAGSVVRGDVPDDALAVGVPARIIEGKGNKMGRVERAETESEDD